MCNPLIKIKLVFHDADTDTDTDTDIAAILARIVARMSACRSACHMNNFRKSRVSNVSATILARTSVLVSASWNSSLTLDRLSSENVALTDDADRRRAPVERVVGWNRRVVELGQ